MKHITLLIALVALISCNRPLSKLDIEPEPGKHYFMKVEQYNYGELVVKSVNDSTVIYEYLTPICGVSRYETDIELFKQYAYLKPVKEN